MELNFNAGQKITLVKFNELGKPYPTQATIKSAEIKPFEQYENTIELLLQPRDKRSHLRVNIKPYHRMIVWNGWYEIDTNVHQSEMSSLYNITNIIQSIDSEPILSINLA